MPFGHQVRVQSRRQFFRPVRHDARLPGVGLLHLQVEASFQIPQSGEVLIEAGPILGTEFPIQLLRIVQHDRQRALATRVGRELLGIRILEIGAEEALVKT